MASRTLAIRTALLAIALVAALVMPSSGALAAGRDVIDLTADVSQLSVRPCLPETVKLGITNNGSKAVFVDVVITAEDPLRPSKPGLSTYVPAQSTVYTNVRVDAATDATAGTYDVAFTTGRTERLEIPVTVVTSPEAQCLPREKMTATATSFQQIPDGLPRNAIDGNIGTLWHTRYSPERDPLPQSLSFELGGTYDVTELVYQPRPTGSMNGTVTSYVVHGSTDGQTFTKVAEGTWVADRTRKVATFSAAGVRHIRLEVLAGHGGFGSAAEVVLYGRPA